MLADLTMKTRLLVLILTGVAALAQTFSAGNIVVTPGDESNYDAAVCGGQSR